MRSNIIQHPNRDGDSRAVVDNDNSNSRSSSSQDDESDADNDQNNTNNNNALLAQQERATLAKRESRMVRILQICMLIVLFMATLFVARGAYNYVKRDQHVKFKTTFTADATKLLEKFHQSLHQHIEAVDTLSVSITAQALSQQQQSQSSSASTSAFPNVTLPNYHVRMANARALSGSFLAVYYVLVTDETRDEWEAYAQTNYHHLDATIRAETILRHQQDMQYNFNGNIPGSSSTNATTTPSFLVPTIFRFGSNDTSFVPAARGTGPYLALWHMNPMPPNLPALNLDGLTHPHFGKSHNVTLQTGHAVINVANNLDGNANTTIDKNDEIFTLALGLSQYRYNVEQYTGDPTSAVSYPVFDSFDLQTRKVVGVISTIMYWSLSFQDVLPPNTQGIMCVISNSHGQAFTYRIDSGIVMYVGNGDHHDPKYNHMVQSSDNYTEASHNSQKQQHQSPILSKSYTSVGLDESYCQYTVRVYPSQSTQDLYVNNDPMRVALTIELVFLSTALVSVLYTIAVQRRQQVVMNRAVASSAIVSSLFPSQVRDQIYQETTTAVVPATATKRNKESHDAVVVPGATTTANAATTTNDNVSSLSRPIANVYHNTTIMFADMVGFTKWSSTRQPVQVFELLETLYQAFDAIAVRRNVFKVETIGDCYVAVTGLPEPQDDHAIIIAKFAHECMNKMSELTQDLVDVLGADTADLAMRVGLHSGSVTGGVLRGQKSRFQLFGDTMNTASRMESNGLPHRIHVSQETANELIAKGKSQWITPRDDKIVAKGKGELQTYWVSIRTNSHAPMSIAANSPKKKPRQIAKLLDPYPQSETFEL